MGVVLFILSGLLYVAFLVGSVAYGATAGAQAVAAAQPVLIACGFVIWALSAWAFLATVLPCKKFLSDNLDINLPDFGSTVISFAIPLVSFYVPWKRLATIRNSLSHCLKTGDRAVREGGHGATIVLGVLYFASAITDRLAGASGEADAGAQAVMFLLAAAAWLVSFLYATFWLWTLSAKRKRASQRFAQGDASVAEVFA